LLGLGGSATGTANLNTGATLRTSYIGGGSTTANVNFNGTQIIATASASPFISDLDVANIDAGGLKIDSDGKNLSSGQIFTGPGGLEKSGLGTLTLSGAYTFGGTKDVIAGKLVTTTNAIGTGAYTVAAGGGLGVVQAAMDAAQTTTGVTFGATGASLDMDLGDFAGNTTAAPLNVTGTLTLNGPVTLNVADILPVASITPIPLVSYVGPKVGGGAFTLGTLPNGVVATLGDNGTGLVSLTVTRAAIPYWVGTPGDLWNTTDANWVNDYTEAATTYANGDPVLFDDRGAFGTTDVVLNTTVTPGSSGVIISNAYTPYTLNTTGVGKISGSTGLLKEGASSLTIGLPLNDYLGVTTLAGGTTTVTKLANGGSASSIGKSSAAATNLVLAGGTLYYTGATVSIDRGFTTTSSGGGIGIDNNLTLSGAAVATGGNFVKTGPGILTLTHNGANTFGGAGDYGLGVLGGTLAMNGTSVTQSNSVIGELRVGFDPGVSAHAVFTNTTVSCTGYLTLGRGNGTGATSTLTATGSTMTSGAFSSGYNAGLSENASNQTITLTNTNWTSNGRILLAEVAGSNTLLTVAGTSTITKNAEYLSIGVEGAATVTLKDSATLTSSGDFNVADVGGSNGTLNIQNTATVNATGSTFWGRGANSTSAINISGGAYNGGLGMVASNATSTSTITQTGGAVVFGANDRLWFGQNGQATWNQSAGTATCNGYLVVGRLAPSVAVWNVTGGTLTQNPPVPGEYPGVILAEAGTGTVNISGTGVFNANGQQINMATSGGNGTLNVNPGGTLRTARIMETNTGTSAVNFDGGTLIANTNANLDFLSGIDTTTVKSGGVTVDSNGQSIGINVAMLDGGGGGGLTKNGAGFLQLNAANTYTGTTTVSAGSLGGTGAVAGPLVVAPTAILAPGASAGTLTAGATTISGTYACEIDGATSDKLVVNGSLNVSAGSLVITQLSAPTAPVYIIASYTGATPANFNSVTGLPAGYSLVYNYLGGNQIALVGTVAPYDSWAASKGLTGANNGPTQDPEFDGISNLLEFILGGNPLASDPSILPAQTLTANDFIFTFNRADESESGITQTFQYGSSLTGWTNISIGASPGTSPVGIVENGASPDTVTVTIPRSSAVGGKLFGRLNAVK
jgi:autotransporter-associated beta strand protein